MTIAFDLDDTLYDRTQPLRKTLLDFEATRELPFDHFNKVFQENSVKAFEKVTKDIWTLEESYVYRTRKTFEHFGFEMTASEALHFQERYYQNQQKIELFPHITEILDFLHEKKIRTIIITNGPTPQQRIKVENLGLNRYFTPEEVMVSSEEEAAKPDETWYVGDSYIHDIVGASNAGWKTVWFNHNNQIADEKSGVQPTKTVTSTYELKKFLLNLIDQ